MDHHNKITNLFTTLAPTAAIQGASLTIPHHITATRDWSLSCLARFMTYQMVIDDIFINAMIQNWGAHPVTRISLIAQKIYLVDFVDNDEMYDVLHNDPWHYRSDVVSMSKVHEPSQLKAEFINHISLWTQFHNVPPEMLSVEGILYLARKIGALISDVGQWYNSRRLFMKADVSFVASEVIGDHLTLDHPPLGAMPIYLVYERTSRLCSYCGIIGYDISGCARRNGLMQLCADPAYNHCHELPLL